MKIVLSNINHINHFYIKILCIRTYLFSRYTGYICSNLQIFLYKLIKYPETYIAETNQKQPHQTNKQQPIDSKQQTATLV